MNLEEFNTCVNLHSKIVYRYILKYIADTEMAKDILQESFLKMWIYHKNIKFSKSKSYLFATAYNKMLNQIKKDSKKESINNVNQQIFSHNEQYSDLKEILEKALNQLSEKQKTVFLLRDYGGHTYEEIEKLTDLSKAQVKVTIHRSRHVIRQYIRKLELIF
jgi:RNA polymerase sigma factor (sigma-70 family)